MKTVIRIFLFLAVLAPVISQAAPEIISSGPTIVFVFPAGAQRGRTIETTVIGQNLKECSGIWISGAGVTGTVTAVQSPVPSKGSGSKGGGAAQKVPKPWGNPDHASEAVKISLTLAPDASLGLRDLRLITPAGISTRCRFLVDDLPDQNVTESGITPATAVQLAKLPVAVNGQLYSGWTGPVGAPDRALFRFNAKAGETIVFDLRGRSLIPYINPAVPGWLDACLTLYDTAGKRLAYVDDNGFDPDPVLFFTPKKEGEYLLEVRDVLYRSSQEFVYRLRIGVIPFITDIQPLGGRRGTETRVALHGVNLGTESLVVKTASDGPEVQPVTVTNAGVSSNARLFAAGDFPESGEKEPNATNAQATRVAVPGTVNGRIGEPGDEDVYVFHAGAGQRLVLDVQARRLGSPLDSVLVVQDANGVTLAQNDDLSPPQAEPSIAEKDTTATVDPRDALLTHQADSRVCYTFSKEGDYFARVRDVRDEGGPAYAYRLTIAPAGADFELSVSPDTARLARGDSTLLGVTAFRMNGFTGEIAIGAGGMPRGFVASPGIIPANQDQGAITITAPADAATGIVCPEISGTAVDGEKRTVRKAFPVESIVQAFYIKHQVPVQACVMRVEEGGGFTIAAEAPAGRPLELPQGGSVDLTVKIVRTGSNSAPVALSLVPKIPEINMRPTSIPAGSDHLTATLSATRQLVVGQRRSLAITGVMRDGKTTWTRTTAAIPVEIVVPSKATPKPSATATPKPAVTGTTAPSPTTAASPKPTAGAPAVSQTKQSGTAAK